MEPNCVVSIDSIPIFDGTTSVNDYFNLIDETALLAGWTVAQKTSIARLKLRGPAKEFLESDEAIKTANWEALKEYFYSQFKPVTIPGQALQNFLKCVQTPYQSAREYLVRLKILGARMAKLSDNAAERAFQQAKLQQDILQQFIFNLRMPVRQRVLSKNPQTLREALEVAEMEELIELTTKNLKIQEVSVQSCHNCKEVGHFKAKCPKIRCFKCEKLGHVSSSCKEGRVYPSQWNSGKWSPESRNREPSRNWRHQNKNWKPSNQNRNWGSTNQNVGNTGQNRNVNFRSPNRNFNRGTPEQPQGSRWSPRDNRRSLNDEATPSGSRGPVARN